MCLTQLCVPRYLRYERASYFPSCDLYGGHTARLQVRSGLSSNENEEKLWGGGRTAT